MPVLAIDPKVYGELLAQRQPAVIHDDEEHAAALECLTELSQKEQASPEELRLIELLAELIEFYEQRRWPRRRAEISGRQLLQFLMDENGLKQTDLADITSQSNISAILAGTRSIGPEVAKKLGKRFHVRPELFLDL